MYRIALDYIIGFRTSLGGITIAPNIPSHWKSFTAERSFRGKQIFLTVTNPDGVNSTIALMTVNGKTVQNAFIDVSSIQEHTITVEILLGRTIE
jgi:cellobiose phosphorylase